MATTDTTTDTTTDGVLDLRPPAESIKAELHRLGLTYESETDAGETWRDYPTGLMAVISLPDGLTVTLTDVATGISQTLSLDQLKQVTKVVTVASTQEQQ
ncbi:MAG: hypothetical protein LKI34_02775 [Bifidobacterium tibiigranuli]|jgi:hypothetical protein|uniref:hypothetical protein n=1 Tax=Bifidobacterium tibiigranuli TaxID=2172043 RepID=UPI0026E9B17C|nr:hypothetical protein [Bifidobacterium tibiigranuli]MCI1673130.1 hypothetical protein [Bifidobacterium tibiigranuli]MCI1713625.1 hypothetical protein [Bifidobacterium tibiigranuli]